MSRREDEHDPLTCEDIDCEFCEEDDFYDDVLDEKEDETQEDEE